MNVIIQFDTGYHIIEIQVVPSCRGDGVCKLKTNSGAFARANSGRIESKHWFDLHPAYSAQPAAPAGPIFVSGSMPNIGQAPWDIIILKLT